MFKFLHAADIHLDSPLKGLALYDGAPRETIQQASRRALENLIQLAIAESVHFVLIAGDLYDGDWKDHNTGLFFVKQMSRLRDAGIPLYLIAGNHDATNKMTRALKLPRNPAGDESFLSGLAAETRRLDDIGVAIHGRSFRTAAEQTNFAQAYPAALAGMFNIGLLHTSLEGDVNHDPYAPCTLDDLLNKNYQYWALGHIHKRRTRHESPPIVYPGNIQGRHIRETGAKGCYLVSVDGAGRATLDFHALDVFRWEECQIDASAADIPDHVLERFRTQLGDLAQRHGDLPLGVRVTVCGASPVHQELAGNPERWTAEFQSAAIDLAGDRVWLERVRFATTPIPAETAERLPSDSAIGELSATFDELGNPDASLDWLAKELVPLKSKLPEDLRTGVDGLALDDPAWLRGILAEVQPLLHARLSQGRAG